MTKEPAHGDDKERKDIEEQFILSRDLRKAAATLSPHEARFIVDFYYQAQKDRIRTNGRIRAAKEHEEPHAVLGWFADRQLDIEKSIRGALLQFARNQQLGVWSMSIHGIGHVIAAGLLANIDIKKAPTAGHIWRFAGLDPTVRWGKGEKRPWNGSLKRLCFIIGESFMKQRNSEKDDYGKLYEQRKAYETAKNIAGEFAETAAQALKEKKFGDNDTRKAYEAGMLPDGRIELRARRWAVKLFLAHYHWVGYELEYGAPPPRPYVIDHGGHSHIIAPPKWPMK